MTKIYGKNSEPLPEAKALELINMSQYSLVWRVKEVIMAEQQEQNGFNLATWMDKMLLYPIPFQVIQSNPEKITQNPGY